MAGMRETLTLITETIAQDAYQTVTRTQSIVFADKKPLYSGEFHAAKAQGIDLQYIMVVRAFEYDGQTMAIYNDREYSIYRTYMRDDDWCELYLSTKEH